MADDGKLLGDLSKVPSTILRRNSKKIANKVHGLNQVLELAHPENDRELIVSVNHDIARYQAVVDVMNAELKGRRK